MKVLNPAITCLMIAVGVTAAPSCKQLKTWDQCGGKGNNCPAGAICSDLPWNGFCCPSGNTCVKQNAYYFQCQPPSQTLVQQKIPTPLLKKANPAAPVPPKAAPTPVLAVKPLPPVPATKSANGVYNYGQVLGLSMLFYEAQRSGKLPANNRIKWRGDSGLNDRAPDGRDVTGGWYDAGDNVKFNLPMAWSAGVLAWSLVDFEQGWRTAKQYEVGLANLKWATDYFIKSIGNGKSIVAQVGNGAQDHSSWTRPEDVVGPKPVYVVTPENPGSDVVGAMAAALAAASQAFVWKDAKYSATLLVAAKKAYDFATKYQGSYTPTSVPDAAAFYKSSSWMDDVAYAAAWLYVRTGDVNYRTSALEWYNRHVKEENGDTVWNNFDWDSNSWGAAVLLSRLYRDNKSFVDRMNNFITAWTKGENGITYTPKGMGFSSPWGSLRHVGNAVFLMKAFAERASSTQITAATRNAIDCTAKKELGYILGDTGRSFVVGYGTNPPQRPHHRGSSCPPIGIPCSWDNYNSPAANPDTLYGAMVGGPDGNDAYQDDRNNYISNEVATDYNAGFTGALAAAEEGLSCKAGRRLAV